MKVLYIAVECKPFSKAGGVGDVAGELPPAIREQGVDIAASESPDLILMDMSLPGIDGWEATRRIKTARESADIPVIALTAHAMTNDREKALAAGCDEYDTKPVDLERLEDKMQQLLSR